MHHKQAVSLAAITLFALGCAVSESITGADGGSPSATGVGGSGQLGSGGGGQGTGTGTGGLGGSGTGAGTGGSTASGGTSGGGAGGSGGRGGSGTVVTPDGGSPDRTSTPPSAAAFEILFPPPSALASASVVVRGTVPATQQGVAGVEVNGVAATSSDGFANWRAVVALAMGDNQIAAHMKDAGGGTLGAPVQVTVTRFADLASIQRGTGAAFSSYRVFGIALDASRTTAVLTDDNFDGIVRVDFATGNRVLASASESTSQGMVGSGYPDISQPRDTTIADNNRALIVDDGKVVAIDITSGARTLLSDVAVGTGPAGIQYDSVAYDAAGDRALVLDYAGDALFSVDLATGNRTIISSTTVGGGLQFLAYGGLELDPVRGRLFTTRAYQTFIIAIDLATGQRSVFSDQSVGTGTAIQTPDSLTLDMGEQTLFVWDSGAATLVGVDLATGNRRLVSGAARGEGVALAGVESLAAGGRLVVAKQGNDLVGIDPVEGTRVVITR